MIRTFNETDMEAVLEIWLNASLKAHDFVEPAFWKSQIENMRNIYLPASETYVYEQGSKVVGFYALHENSLAAIFVVPESQGLGIGKSLVSHAKARRPHLTLTVYKENEASCRFYLSQGFTVFGERTDEHTGHRELMMTTRNIHP